MKTTHLYLVLISFMLIVSCEDSSFPENSLGDFQNPFALKYIEVIDARESKTINSTVPTVQTGGLTPVFELVSIRNGEGTVLDDSFLQHVSIGGVVPVVIEIDEDEGRVDENGNPLTSISTIDTSNNGAISIADGHNFGAGDYYFTIKVSTEDEGVQYSTTFDDAFRLTIGPLLPSSLIYSPKNQNLVFGDAGSKTSLPILPLANPEVSYEIDSVDDKLVIDSNTGAISIAPDYNYTVFDTISPVVNVVSKISGEISSFDDSVIVIVTDVPVEVPIETVYFFYPTLKTTGSFPIGGEGFTVQVDVPGNGADIWGEVDNSRGRSLAAPEERPEANTAQTVLETQTNTGAITQLTSSWMVTTTQDLTVYEFGFDLSFNYHYQPAFQNYLADGRTPTDLEVYISTDYTGGDIQDVDGNFLNGTWTQVNESMRCNRSEGVASNGASTGAPWGPEFIGTPYPGRQDGEDPDNRKVPGTTFYNKWVRCSYDISPDLISTNFTVAFKIASYFEGELLNNDDVPGRGGNFFLSDFNYKAVESSD